MLEPHYMLLMEQPNEYETERATTSQREWLAEYDVDIGDGLKNWQPFVSFPYPLLGADGQGKEIKEWVKPTLAGNAAVVSHVAMWLRQRSR